MKWPRFVSPDGTLVAQPEKVGLLMGNRGVLRPIHYERELPCAPQAPWITCVLKEDGKPLPKTTVKYTKLFMLDEVTAFAAGHRPCRSCQHHRYEEFVWMWGKSSGYGKGEVDEKLAYERGGGNDRKKIFTSALEDLPHGTFVKLPGSDQPYLTLWGKLFPWTVNGYDRPVAQEGSTMVQVLTPKPIVLMFKKGFPLSLNREETIHSSLMRFL